MAGGTLNQGGELKPFRMFIRVRGDLFQDRFKRSLNFPRPFGLRTRANQDHPRNIEETARAVRAKLVFSEAILRSSTAASRPAAMVLPTKPHAPVSRISIPNYSSVIER
jgi:hypothetical protein